VLFVVSGASYAAAAPSAASDLIYDKVTALVKSDSRWGDASVEVSDLDLSALDSGGKQVAVR